MRLLLNGRFVPRSSFLAFLATGVLSSFLGVVLATWRAFCSWILVLGSSFLAFLFLAFRFLAFRLLAFRLLASSLLALRVLGALGALGALGSLGSRRPLRGLRLPRLVACRELWLGILIRVFRERVYAVIGDILLSERNGRGKGKGNGRASHA